MKKRIVVLTAVLLAFIILAFLLLGKGPGPREAEKKWKGGTGYPEEPIGC